MMKLFTSFFLFLSLNYAAVAQFAQVGQQLDGNAPNDNFGWSVALDAVGQTMVVGAPLYDNDFGQVRVYKESQGTWSQIGGDINGTEIGHQFGFAVKLNAAGNRMALSGLSGNPSTLGGHARVYEFENGQWVQMGQTLPGTNSGDQFGFSMDMNGAGDRLVIGSPKSNVNGADSGNITTLEWDGVSWGLLGTSIIPGAAAGDQFGISVSMSADGNTIAVGSVNHGPAGQVQVFQWQNNGWDQLGADIDGQNTSEAFGISVSLSDDGRKLVSSAFVHDHGNGFGSVRAYEYSNNSWVQIGTDIRSNSSTEGFGEKVAISGDGMRIAVGTQSNDDNAMSSGKVNLYEWQNGSWTELLNPIRGTAQFDNLGKSVDLNQSGNRVAAGANLAGGTQGFAVVYQDTIMPVSIDNYFSQHQIDVFAYDQVLEIKSARELGEIQVRVFTIEGKQMIVEGFSNAFGTKIRHALIPGLYAVALEHKEGILWRKVVIR